MVNIIGFVILFLIILFRLGKYFCLVKNVVYFLGFIPVAIVARRQRVTISATVVGSFPTYMSKTIIFNIFKVLKIL